MVPFHKLLCRRKIIMDLHCTAIHRNDSHRLLREVHDLFCDNLIKNEPVRMLPIHKLLPNAKVYMALHYDAQD
jgi:hypothetical protein